MVARVTHHIDVEGYGEIRVALIQGYNEIGLTLYDDEQKPVIYYQLSTDESESLRQALAATEQQADNHDI